MKGEGLGFRGSRFRVLQGSLKGSLTGFSKRVVLGGTFVLRLWGLIGFSVAYGVHGSCKLLGSGFRVGWSLGMFGVSG